MKAKVIQKLGFRGGFYEKNITKSSKWVILQSENWKKVKKGKNR
jgi:hypothetical protein